MDGVVHRQVNHGVVEDARRAWPRNAGGGYGLGGEHVPIDHDIRAGGPGPTQTRNNDDGNLLHFLCLLEGAFEDARAWN